MPLCLSALHAHCACLLLSYIMHALGRAICCDTAHRASKLPG